MIHTSHSSEEQQSGFEGEGERNAVLRMAGMAIYFSAAVAFAGGLMWLFPAATPDPVRNGVGVATAVVLAYPGVKAFRPSSFTRQALAAVAAGGIAAVVSWVLPLVFGA